MKYIDTSRNMYISLLLQKTTECLCKGTENASHEAFLWRILGVDFSVEAAESKPSNGNW